uniref:Secreted protein n=1 Tax=Steinernema glaseri TaxID=37863 RepID=A0A1I7YC25_9BILA
MNSKLLRMSLTCLLAEVVGSVIISYHYNGGRGRPSYEYGGAITEDNALVDIQDTTLGNSHDLIMGRKEQLYTSLFLSVSLYLLYSTPPCDS